MTRRLADKEVILSQRYAQREITPEIQACLPQDGVLNRYVEWARHTSHMSPLSHLAAILPVFGHELARRGFTFGPMKSPFRFWTAIIAPTGVGKSTCRARARDFGQDFWSATTRSLTDPFVQAEGSLPGILESLQEHYDDRLDRTLAFLELDEFDKLLTHDDTAAVMNRLYDGEDYQRHLRHLQKDGKQGTIRRPTLQACFTTTTEALQRVVRPHHLEGGLFSRLLWFYDDPVDELAPRVDPCPDLRKRALVWWTKLAEHMNAGATARDEAHPHIVLPDQVMDNLEAMLWEDIADRLRSRDRFAGVLTRALEHAKMVACAYAVSRGFFEPAISDATAAANLTATIIGSVEGAHDTLATSWTYQLQQKAAEVIRRAGEHGLPRTKLYRALRVGKAELDQALEGLLDSGTVELKQVETTGGRPRTRYVHYQYVEEANTSYGPN